MGAPRLLVIGALDTDQLRWYCEGMNQDEMINTYWQDARRVIRIEAYDWRVPVCDIDDVVQATLEDIYRYPIRAEEAREPLAYFMTCVRTRVRRVLFDYRGYEHKKGPKLTKKAIAEKTTASYEMLEELESKEDYMDERILPLVPSAEDTYLASLPTRRQEALRGAIEGLAPRQRTALTLRFYEELEVADIASAMGLTYVQTSRAITEGLRKLRVVLNPGQAGYPKAVMSNGKGKR